MNVSHPSVHPVEVAPLPPTDGGALVPPRVRMKVKANSSIFLCLMPVNINESFQLFCHPSYLVAAVSLQSVWSLSLAILDIHALLVGRSLQNYRVVSFFSIGDGVTSTLTFAAACASAGITVLIGNDLGLCAQNHCKQFETATAMAFLSWFTALPSFLLNFWSLSSR
ncbi:hypothetical protein OSB04_013498 [Centaurea solstitialis]|uniref:CASP-like protein n=1 Tax=Centaurea solstitialis TaxID=347529 RepID=A0AA38TDF1_9ASTR|nr:hypothetical protein OSB04_013498 [Centaurea solstitialis]